MGLGVPKEEWTRWDSEEEPDVRLNKSEGRQEWSVSTVPEIYV